MNIIRKLYQIRIRIESDQHQTVLNVSLLFALVCLIFAIWLCVAGAVLSLLLGYRFSIETQDPGFDLANPEAHLRQNLQKIGDFFRRIFQSGKN